MLYSYKIFISGQNYVFLKVQNLKNTFKNHYQSIACSGLKNKATFGSQNDFILSDMTSAERIFSFGSFTPLLEEGYLYIDLNIEIYVYLHYYYFMSFPSFCHLNLGRQNCHFYDHYVKTSSITFLSKVPLYDHKNPSTVKKCLGSAM